MIWQQLFVIQYIPHNSKLSTLSSCACTKIESEPNFLDPYWESFGVSLADPTPDGADGAIVRHNLIIGGVPSYWAQQGVGGHYGLGIEAGANSLQVYGNVIGGVFDQAISVAVDSYGAQIYNNYVCKLELGAGMGIGQETGPSPGASYSNNTILDSCPASLPNLGAGSHSITATATDVSGSTQSATQSFSVTGK